MAVSQGSAVVAKLALTILNLLAPVSFLCPRNLCCHGPSMSHTSPTKWYELDIRILDALHEKTQEYEFSIKSYCLCSFLKNKPNVLQLIQHNANSVTSFSEKVSLCDIRKCGLKKQLASNEGNQSMMMLLRKLSFKNGIRLF